MIYAHEHDICKNCNENGRAAKKEFIRRAVNVICCRSLYAIMVGFVASSYHLPKQFCWSLSPTHQ